MDPPKQKQQDNSLTDSTQNDRVHFVAEQVCHHPPSKCLQEFLDSFVRVFCVYNGYLFCHYVIADHSEKLS